MASALEHDREATALRELPAGWKWRSLRDLTANYFSGRRPKGGVAGIDVGPLSLGGEHLDWSGYLNLATPRRIPESFADTIPACEVALNDILVVKDGATTGKTALVRKLPERAFVNEHLFVVRPTDEVLPRYLFYWLWSRPGFDQIMLDFRGAAQGGIGRTFVDKVAVPWAPLEIQRRIVTRIDELFSELDDGEEELARARADLETYRKVLLKAAVTGELTADWRALNSDQVAARPSNMLDGSKVERRSRQTSPSPKQKALMWPGPDGWRWSQIGSESFVTKLAGFEYTKYVTYTPDGDLPVLKAENAGPNGFRPTAYSRVRSDSVSVLTRSKLHGGEILVVFVGAGTGNVGLVPHDQEFFLGPNVGMIRANDELNPDYAELFLRSALGKQLLLASMKAVAQPSLSMTTIRQTPILLPSRCEQDEIVSRVHEALTEMDDMRSEINDESGGSAALRQSILAAAFRGDLVR